MCVCVYERERGDFSLYKVGRFIPGFTQQNRLNLQGLWPGLLCHTNAGVTAPILDYADGRHGVGVLLWAVGYFCGLDGMHSRAWVRCMCCEIGVTCWDPHPRDCGVLSWR